MSDENLTTPTLSAAKRELLALLLKKEGVKTRSIEKISRRGDASLYPLSFAQERMCFFETFEEGTNAYNVAAAVRLAGRLDVPALEESFTEILRRHEVLRAVFSAGEEGPAQEITPCRPFSLDVTDLAALPASEREAEALRLASRESRVPFDLARGPLVRARLLRLSAEDSVLLVTMHHIVSDAWSIGVLVREVAALYEAFSAGRPSPLPELPVQYADFAAWQRERVSGERLERGLDYWRRQLEGAETVLALQTDRPRPSAQTFRGAKLALDLPPELARALRELGRREGATLFMTLLAAFQTLLHRYTGQADILTGAPVANRQHRELEPLIGFFLNTLVMRADFSGDPTFRELLGRVRETALGAFAHQEVPFEKLVDVLQPERDLSRSPLFQAGFALRNSQPQDLALAGLRLTPVDVETGTAKFDLMLYVDDEGDALRAALEYNTDLFEAATAARMCRHFETLLRGVVSDPEARVSDLPLMSEGERRRVVVEWNDTADDDPRAAALHHLVEAQAAATPDATAVEGLGGRLSYGELNRRANRLAADLRRRGVGPDTLVGLLAERGVETMTGLLAILKAGGACVPVDPRYPRERVEFMLADARIKVLLTQERLAADLPAHAAEVVLLDNDAAGPTSGAGTGGDDDNPAVGMSPDNLLYVLYTSGSTGRPKGVAMTHRPLVNLVAWQLKHQSARPGDRTLQFTSLSFDVSFQEVFTTWCSGGTLVLISDDDRRDSGELLRVLAAEKINRLFLPFIALQQLAEAASAGGAPAPAALTEVITAGEQLQVTQAVAALFRGLPGCPLFNHYGPTEAHVVSSHALSGSPDAWPALPPIGRPVANTRLYVLDARLQPVPEGAAGELYLGGVALARGYLNRPDLTGERFLPDPHAGLPGARMYRTGDLARFLPDGSVECLGRIDGQVKIRGFRVEVGEIEAVLSEHEAVGEAVVVVREDAPGEKRLVAYVVARGGEGGAPEGAGLRRFVKEKLPEYMVPSAFVVMDALPLTPSGKVDRRALPAPARESFAAAAAGEFAAPRNAAEELLAQVWADVLGLARVGVHDNFFELGGDSILTIQTVARARRLGLALTPKQMFRHQTVAELAAVIDGTPAVRAEQGEVTGPAPLTPIQRWFFEHEFAEPHHWNMAYVFEPRRALDVATLDRALVALVGHHDALRLSFTREGAGWTQTVAAHREDPLVEVISLAGLSPEGQAAALEREAGRIQSGIDMASGRLLRAAWFDYGEGVPGRLFLAAHHLCVDGVSWRVLAEDLQRAYEQLDAGQKVQLPAKTTSWKEWAARLEERAAGAEAAAEADEWLDARRLEASPLPADFPGGENVEGAAHVLSVEFDEAETEALLRDVPKVFQTRINDVLLTALARSFARWTGSRTLLLDLEGHGREDVVEGVDISRTVGWFTNIAPVPLSLGDAAGLRDSLAAVVASLRRVPNNGVGYGLLRHLTPDAGLRERLAAMPRAEVSFNYMGQVDQSFGGAALLRPLAVPVGDVLGPRNALPNPLYVNGIVFEGRLRMRFKFSERTFRRSTIRALAEDYMSELRLFVEGCRAPGAARHAPEDFPLARLDEAALARAVAQARFAGDGADGRGRVEDIYPLSPAQEGILFHCLYEPQSEVYSVQIVCALRGLDVAALGRAWQSAVARHAIFRTAFVWQGLDRPVQVVGRRARLPVERRDLRGLDAGEQAREVESFLRADRARGYELERAPLMRLALLQTGDDEYQFVWSQHHLLLDGWSISLVLKEVFTLYAAECEGERLALPAPAPFGDYVGWLQQKSLADAEEFWRAALAGYAPPAGPLSIERAPVAGEGYGERWAEVPAETTARLRALARQNRLTLNTVMQGAWALLLSHYAGARDVVFGATASGRPAGLEGVESMVGLFINVMPLRARLPEPAETALEWLRELQGAQFEVRQYEHTPLAQIQKWSGVASGTPLFRTVLSFENYPVDESLREHVRSLDVTGVRTFSRTNYQITIVVTPGERLGLRVVYDGSRFDGAAIDGLLQSLAATLTRLAERPEAPLGEYEEALAGAARRQRVQQQQQTEKKNLSRFKQIKPKAVSLPGGALVRTGLLPTGETLPLVVEPAAAGVDLIDWAAGAREEIVGHLLRHGAVLFRGFGVGSVDRFEQFARTICPELFGEYGDLPREGQGGKVYGSTPYPHDKPILFHNESSHLHRWPMRIWFYCVTAALRGGETPIVDCREVYRRLSPETRDRFAARGLRYVRNYIEGLDVSWQDFFRTTDRAEVEEQCRRAGATCEWRGNNLRTSEVRRAVARHPRTGETVFFNQIQLHHVACLEPDIRESLARTFSPDDFPRNVYYGDGTPIDDEVVREVSAAYEASATRAPWQAGDIILLDNMLAAHGRSTYEGPRKIVVAMGDMVSEETAAAAAV